MTLFVIGPSPRHDPNGWDHYVARSDDCATEQEAVAELLGYMSEKCRGRGYAFVRSWPEATTDTDFETKEKRVVGHCRFSTQVIQQEHIDFGAAQAKAANP